MEEEDYPCMVEVKLIESILPVDRGNRYEDPLTSILEERGLGAVTGGGTQLKPRANPKEQDIEYVNLEVELANLDEALSVLKQKLNELGVPVGSLVRYYTDDEELHEEPVGEMEILHVYLDGINLSDDVYENASLDTICETIVEKMGPLGELREPGSWPSETLIYFVGKSADEMFKVIEGLHGDIPLLQNARIVFQRREKDKTPVEMRLPLYA
jgi:hypothetical protein